MRTSVRTAAVCLAALVISNLVSARAQAVAHDSPEVRALIERGLKYLEANDDERLGAKCLSALCFLKNGRDKTHPKVQSAVAACQKFQPTSETAIYSLGIAIMFLAELNDSESKRLAETLVRGLATLQKPHGGFGYTYAPSGDTSQSQYAALAFWTAYRNGIDIPQEPVEKLCDWLMKTQDPTGGFGYQGIVPGTSGRTQQNEVAPSLSAAGLGSMYICADLLNIRDRKQSNGPQASKLPPSLQVAKDPKAAIERPGFTPRMVNVEAVRRTMADGNKWMAEKAVIPHERWVYYYLYGLERYYSFKELCEGKFVDEPEWYNQGFAFLQKSQQSDGSWVDREGAVSHTAFGVLFLSRSTKAAIKKVVKDLGDGVLLGGMGLPKNVADIRERNGKLVETPLAGSVDELLAILEDPNNPDLADLADSQQVIKLEGDTGKREGQIAKLRAMVSAGNFETRIVAVRSLGRAREMKNVPLLLFAMTDPDIRVCVEADKALKFLSRKFEGVGLTLPATRQDLQSAAAAWRKWYLSVQPDAELID